MSKLQNRVTLSDGYLRNRNLERCSEILKCMTVSDVRVLLYIEDFLYTRNHNYILYEQDDLYNLLLKKIDRDEISKDIRVDLLIEKKATHTVPLIYFNWALNDLRSALYLGQKIINSHIPIPALNKKSFLELIQLIVRVNYIAGGSIGNLNFSPIEINRGVGGVEYFVDVISFFKQQYLEQRVKSKSVKWIDKSNDHQIDFLFDYLVDCNEMIVSEAFIPANSEEKYAQVLASIDYLPDLSSEECNIYPSIKKGGKWEEKNVNNVRDYYLSSMKNAWNGRVHRKVKVVEKSECQVNITKGNFVKLSVLSELYGTSPNKLINEWIAKEHKELDQDN